MSTKERMFRVYKCPFCGYAGYKEVGSPQEDSVCNLCSKTISPSSDMSYVRNADEARKAIQRVVFRSQMKQESKPKPRHGLGVKKRILYMVSDLSELNRGRGVSRGRILDECRDVDIDLDKAERFLYQLEEEGRIIVVDDKLMIVPEDE